MGEEEAGGPVRGSEERWRWGGEWKGLGEGGGVEMKAEGGGTKGERERFHNEWTSEGKR